MRSSLTVLVAAIIAALALGATPAVAASAVNTVRPTVDGVVAVGQAVLADPGTWDTDGLDFAYSWLLDGEPIAGATGQEYTPAAPDQGHALSVRVVASLHGAPAGEATSDASTVLGEGPGATSTPVITGDGHVGGVLQASPGTWSRPDLSFTYQWLRDGEPIAEATAPSYTVTGEDWCRDLAVVVTASEEGYADGVAASPAFRTSCQIIETCCIPIGLDLRLVHEVVTPRQHPRLKVRILTPGNNTPSSGTIEVRVQGGRGRTVHLRPADDGRLTIRLPRQDVGRHRVLVRFEAPPSSGWRDGNDVTLLRVRPRHHRR